ncbi:phosphatase [Celerinatantimonas sp. YJH-8]|uniref:phosphatase n=1 Tax=Celerinatantimonas sp. YJH-8 TaxID=3228714 RepID=UPI0038C20B71
MKVVDGDLIELALEGNFDVIVHGSNCFHSMDGGIALSIRHVFPEAYQADQETAFGDREKLGTLSTAIVTRGEVCFTVVNAYTQFDYHGEGNADYEAVQMVFAEVRQRYHGLRIGYPLIGAGLGGGNWVLIEKIIDQALEGEDHTLVRFNG